MHKLAITKLAVRTIAGLGTGTVSGSIIKNNVAPSNLIEQISVAVAAVAIGSMASEAVGNHTDAKIDEIVSHWNANKQTTTN